MYVIRRVYKAKPGQARKAALLLRKIADGYTEAGQRSKCLVYYNGGTLPCPKDELHRLYMQWTTDVIDSPYREGNTFPDMWNVSKEFKEFLDESDGSASWIEFWEEIK